MTIQLTPQKEKTRSSSGKENERLWKVELKGSRDLSCLFTEELTTLVDKSSWLFTSFSPFQLCSYPIFSSAQAYMFYRTTQFTHLAASTLVCFWPIITHRLLVSVFPEKRMTDPDLLEILLIIRI